MNKVIFCSGLPKAGKSVTLHGLFEVLRAAGARFFLERVHPDQEGNWTSETAGGQDMARGIKNGLKAAGTFWSEAFVEHACRSIAGLARTFPLVLADMGGLPSSQNRQIVAAAKATGAAVQAVILYPRGTDPTEWQEFWSQEGIDPILLESGFAGLAYQGPEFNAEKARLVGVLKEEI